MIILYFDLNEPFSIHDFFFLSVVDPPNLIPAKISSLEVESDNVCVSPCVCT